MKIRPATIVDCEVVRDVHLCSFPAAESTRIAEVAVDLLCRPTQPETISLVAENAGAVVAHIAFSPVEIAGNPGCLAYILAPLAVRPDRQGEGIGFRLVEHGLRRLSTRRVNLVLVYGDPNYYARFGFRADTALPCHPPYTLQYPFGWQALALTPYDLGEKAVAISCVEALCDPELW